MKLMKKLQIIFVANFIMKRKKL